MVTEDEVGAAGGNICQQPSGIAEEGGAISGSVDGFPAGECSTGDRAHLRATPWHEQQHSILVDYNHRLIYRSTID